MPRKEEAVRLGREDGSATGEPGESAGRGNSAKSWSRSGIPGLAPVIGRQGNNGAGLRKARFQCGRIGLRIELRHPAVDGPGRSFQLVVLVVLVVFVVCSVCLQRLFEKSGQGARGDRDGT